MATRNEPETALVTLAALRTSADGERTEVLFNERHQIFTLPRTRAAARHGDMLRELSGSRRPIRASFDPHRGLIRQVEEAPEREVKKFERARTVLDEPQKTFRVNLDKVDPTRFNVVDHVLDVPLFRLCKKIVPSYKKAKEIFDFCAAQSCNLPGPFDVSPCIPFQYVRDGCYARAHKMRKIITEEYGYCCEKVFSFANQNLDTLAVQANKWGGCCVTWWYHVAPLVRVRVRLGKLKVTLALVIDPGMFDKPVLLTSWLYAQENTTCDVNANVSMYSIQPGSAYSPANYAGTAFSTDPDYSKSNATCNLYKNLLTCP